MGTVLEIKAAGPEAGSPLLPGADFKNEWNSTSTPPYTLDSAQGQLYL